VKRKERPFLLRDPVPPQQAAELRDINARLEAIRKVMGSLIGRRNFILKRAKRPTQPSMF
jgi:hypothetical protein